MKKDSIAFVFTSGFPCDLASEPYLWDELPFLAQAFSKVYFIPKKIGKIQNDLPGNCFVIGTEMLEPYKGENFFDAIKIMLKELPSMIKHRVLVKCFRYNLALIRQILQRSASYEKLVALNAKGNNVFLYSYWSGNDATLIALLKKRNPKWFSISRAHGYDLFEEQTEYGYIPFRRLQLRYLNAMFSVSKTGEAHLKKKNPRHKDKIRTAYLGTNDYGQSPLPVRQNVIVSCAYLRRLKGVEYIPDVLMNIKSSVKWVHFGGGELLEEIMAKVAKLPSNISVELLGGTNRETIMEYYVKNPVTLFLSLSEREALPVSIMEAISFGIPVAATDVGGCSEIVCQQTGILIPDEFDDSKLADEIELFFDPARNNVQFRNAVRNYWKSNFFAAQNYADFYKHFEHINN